MAKGWRQLILLFLLFACVPETTRLRRQLNDPDPQTRANAARRLGELKDRNSLPLLVNLLNDSEPIVRFEAGLALGKIGDTTAIAPLFTAARNEPREDVAMAFTRALGDIGPAATDPLINLTGSPKTAVRIVACHELGRMRIKKAVDPLIRRLDDPDPNVRRKAIFALRRIGDQKGLSAIASKISSIDPVTEQAAEAALSGQGYEEQLGEIRALLRRFNR